MTAATVAHVYMHSPTVEVCSHDLSTKAVGLWPMTRPLLGQRNLAVPI